MVHIDKRRQSTARDDAVTVVAMPNLATNRRRYVLRRARFRFPKIDMLGIALCSLEHVACDVDLLAMTPLRGSATIRATGDHDLVRGARFIPGARPG